MLQQILGIEQVAHDLGRARLAALLEQFGTAVLLGFKLGIAAVDWEEAAICVAGVGERDIQRFIIALVDIDDGRVCDIGFVRPARLAPLGEKVMIARRRITPMNVNNCWI